MFNYRDIGGHAVPGGRIRTGLLYRSNAVVGLGAAEAEALGIRTALDLREPGEREAEPATVGAAVVHVVPVIDGDVTAPPTLYEFTRWIVEHRGRSFADAARLLAHSELPAVFFCSSGKDRTGVLAGFLLAALGVADEDVVQNYAKTESLMPESYYELAMARSRRAGMSGESGIADLGSPPALMAEVLATAGERHGGAAGYLVAHGLAAEDLDRLRSRLIG